MWDEMIQAILRTLIEILAPILAAYAVVLVNQAIKKVKGSIAAEQYALAVEIITKLVLAAEQTFPHEQFKEKKSWVIGQAELELAKYNINLDLDEMVSILESAVYEEFKKVEY